MYHRNFSPALRTSLNVLHIIGLHPYKQNGAAKIRLYLALLSTTMAGVFHLPYLLINFNGVETFKKLEFLAEFLMTIFRIFLLTIKRKSTLSLLTDLPRFWPSNMVDEETEMKANKLNDYCHRFLKTYIILIVFNVIAIMLPNIYFKKLMFPSFYYCDATTSPCYEIHQIWITGMMAFQISPLFMGSDVVFLALVTQIYVGLELIKAALKSFHLIPRCNDEIPACKRALAMIVQQHNFIMSFIKKLNNYYSTFLLLQMWASSIGMILSLYMITSNGIPPNLEHLIRYGLLWGTLVCQLLIFCKGGTIIYEQTCSIATAAYDIEWHQPGRAKLRTNLSFIIQRAHKVERLRVGDMYDLNLVLLANTIKTSLSIYMLLLTIDKAKS